MAIKYHPDRNVSIPLEQGSVFRHITYKGFSTYIGVSIPLEQGSVFRLIEIEYIPLTRDVSIPLEQGSVFRPKEIVGCLISSVSLNPFRTGQCLSTRIQQYIHKMVSQSL